MSGLSEDEEDSLDEEDSEEEDSEDEESGEETEAGSDSESADEVIPSDKELFTEGTQQQYVSSSSDEGVERERCPICLNRFIGQDLGVPENCEHIFCLECIKEWSKNVNTCPIDRNEFNYVHLKRQPDGKILKKIHIRVQSKGPDESAVVEETTLCEVCRRGDREDRLLLCDACDLAYHCECLDPPLFRIPIEEWFCPPCSGVMTQLESSGAVPSASRSRRVIPRTRASESVRVRVQNRRTYPSASSSRSTSVQRPKKRKRRTYRRCIRKVVKLARTKGAMGSGKGSKGERNTAVMVTYRKRYKRRRRRKTKKSTRLPSRTTESNIQSAKERIAKRLGLVKARAGADIPDVRSKPGPSKGSSSERSHSLFGIRDQLMDFNENFNEELAGPSTSSTSRNPPRRLEVSADPLNFLDSILEGQKKLHTKSDKVVIRNDGSLILKEEDKKIAPKKSSTSRTVVRLGLYKPNGAVKSITIEKSKSNSSSLLQGALTKKSSDSHSKPQQNSRATFSDLPRNRSENIHKTDKYKNKQDSSESSSSSHSFNTSSDKNSTQRKIQRADSYSLNVESKNSHQTNKKDKRGSPDKDLSNQLSLTKKRSDLHSKQISRTNSDSADCSKSSHKMNKKNDKHIKSEDKTTSESRLTANDSHFKHPQSIKTHSVDSSDFDMPSEIVSEAPSNMPSTILNHRMDILQKRASFLKKLEANHVFDTTKVLTENSGTKDQLSSCSKTSSTLMDNGFSKKIVTSFIPPIVAKSTSSQVNEIKIKEEPLSSEEEPESESLIGQPGHNQFFSRTLNSEFEASGSLLKQSSQDQCTFKTLNSLSMMNSSEKEDTKPFIKKESVSSDESSSHLPDCNELIIPKIRVKVESETLADMFRKDLDETQDLQTPELAPTQKAVSFKRSLYAETAQSIEESQAVSTFDNLPCTQAIGSFNDLPCTQAVVSFEDLPCTQAIGPFEELPCTQADESFEDLPCTQAVGSFDNLPCTQAVGPFEDLPCTQAEDSFNDFPCTQAVVSFEDLPCTQAIGPFEELPCTQAEESFEDLSCTQVVGPFEDLPCTQLEESFKDLPCTQAVGSCKDLPCQAEQSFDDLPCTQVLTPFDNLPCTQTGNPFQDLPCTQAISSFEDLPCTQAVSSFEDLPCTQAASSFEDLPCTQAVSSFEDLPCTQAVSSFEDLPCTQAVGSFDDYPCTQAVDPFKDLPCTQAIQSFEDLPCTQAIQSFEDLPCTQAVQSFEDLPCTQTIQPLESSKSSSTVDSFEDLPCTQAVSFEKTSKSNSTFGQSISPKLPSKQTELKYEINDSDLPATQASRLNDSLSCTNAIDPQLAQSKKASSKHSATNTDKHCGQLEAQHLDDKELLEAKQAIALLRSGFKVMKSSKVVGVHKNLPQVLTTVPVRRPLVPKPVNKRTFSFEQVKKHFNLEEQSRNDIKNNSEQSPYKSNDESLLKTDFSSFDAAQSHLSFRNDLESLSKLKPSKLPNAAQTNMINISSDENNTKVSGDFIEDCKSQKSSRSNLASDSKPMPFSLSKETSQQMTGMAANKLKELSPLACRSMEKACSLNNVSQTFLQTDIFTASRIKKEPLDPVEAICNQNSASVDKIDNYVGESNMERALRIKRELNAEVLKQSAPFKGSLELGISFNHVSSMMGTLSVKQEKDFGVVSQNALQMSPKEKDSVFVKIEKEDCDISFESNSKEICKEVDLDSVDAQGVKKEIKDKHSDKESRSHSSTLQNSGQHVSKEKSSNSKNLKVEQSEYDCKESNSSSIKKRGHGEKLITHKNDLLISMNSDKRNKCDDTSKNNEIKKTKFIEKGESNSMKIHSGRKDAENDTCKSKKDFNKHCYKYSDNSSRKESTHSTTESSGKDKHSRKESMHSKSEGSGKEKHNQKESMHSKSEGSGKNKHSRKESMHSKSEGSEKEKHSRKESLLSETANSRNDKHSRKENMHSKTESSGKDKNNKHCLKERMHFEAESSEEDKYSRKENLHSKTESSGKDKHRSKKDDIINTKEKPKVSNVSGPLGEERKTDRRDGESPSVAKRKRSLDVETSNSTSDKSKDIQDNKRHKTSKEVSEQYLSDKKKKHNCEDRNRDRIKDKHPEKYESSSYKCNSDKKSVEKRKDSSKEKDFNKHSDKGSYKNPDRKESQYSSNENPEKDKHSNKRSDIKKNEEKTSNREASFESALLADGRKIKKESSSVEKRQKFLKDGTSHSISDKPKDSGENKKQKTSEEVNKQRCQSSSRSYISPDSTSGPDGTGKLGLCSNIKLEDGFLDSRSRKTKAHDGCDTRETKKLRRDTICSEDTSSSDVSLLNSHGIIKTEVESVNSLKIKAEGKSLVADPKVLVKGERSSRDLKEDIASEIKDVLKPFFTVGVINKDDYKDIMRRAVPKVFLNCGNCINPEKIKKLVLGYISKLKNS